MVGSAVERHQRRLVQGKLAGAVVSDLLVHEQKVLLVILFHVKHKPTGAV
jgi:hypothetical protein